MSIRGSQLLEEIMMLPLQERAELAEQILSSLDETPDRHIEELCIKEIQSRLDAYDRGEMEVLSEEETAAWLNGLGAK